MLFPSKEMRDWSKFAWKKGDVLIRTNSEYCIGIFDEWTSDDYSTFSAKYINLGLSDNFSCSYTCKTEEWEKTENSKNYISEIERVMNGKLNLQTLEIQTQPEFKDGDIVVAEEDNYYDRVIFIAAIKDDIVSKALINVRYEDYEVNYNEYRFGHNRNLRLATDSEKKQLFSALAKEGKAWDSDKKAIVDLKPEVELKPFDKVLVRDFESQAWQLSFFSYKDSDSYYCCNGCSWDKCIPYIGNESLLGTTKDMEG